MTRIGIIGAGIAGLSAAYRLQQEGAEVVVLEASDRVGGVIRSEQTNGFLVEHGPNSIRAGSSALETLIDDLDLDRDRVWADDAAATRYVVRDGEPTPLPTSVRSFLSTPLFSTSAKLRLLAEPFVPRSGEGADESIAQFTRRRLGTEVLDYAMAPFVGGVFAGSPDELSIRHAFPRLAALERDHGSLFLGALKNSIGGPSNDEESAPSGLFSFDDGLETLPRALAHRLADCIHLNRFVSGIAEEDNQWRLSVENRAELPRTPSFDGLISTVPLHRLAAIEFETPIDLNPLASVSYPPLSVLALGYPRDAITHPLDGFGMLVPPTEHDIDILGTIFSSTLFPNRAPEGQVLLTTFVGGAHAPQQATPDVSSVQALVERDLDRLLGVDGTPTFRRHVHWPHAIPQYSVGYGRVKETLDALERQHPRLAFAGNYRNGVSVGEALTSGIEAAERLTDRLDLPQV